MYPTLFSKVKKMQHIAGLRWFKWKFWLQISSPELVKYGIIGGDTCMGDHKVRMKSIKPITNLSLRSIKLIFFNWVHKHLIQKKNTLPGLYSDNDVNDYGAACLSGVSNENLNAKVPIYELLCLFFHTSFPITLYNVVLLVFFLHPFLYPSPDNNSFLKAWLHVVFLVLLLSLPICIFIIIVITKQMDPVPSIFVH